MLPNFIIGGAAASGTSYLSYILLQHPEVYLPKKMRPEPHFFYYTEKYNKGIDWYSTEWFSDYRGQKVAGERSSSYLYLRESALRIKKHLPEVKLIFVLRNPIERAWANYRYTVLSGLEDLSFQDALKEESRRIKSETGIWKEVQPHDYTGRSMYGDQIEHFLKYFSWEQILIVNSEKLSLETEDQICRITHFLDIKDLKSFRDAPNFTSLSVINPIIQMNCRSLLGDDKFNLIIESIRRKEKNIFSFASNENDLKVIKQLSENIHGDKQLIPEDCYDYLYNLFKNDQDKFFKISKNYIDFEPWF